MNKGISGTENILIGTKSLIIILLFGGSINPGAAAPVEGQFLPVIGNDILTKFRPDTLQHIANMPHNGEIMLNGMLAIEENIAESD